MKIGIYSKWIETLGGGEKVATVMAEILSKDGHEVDLISTFKNDKKNIEKKMAVDLSRVKIVGWQERSYEKLVGKTRKYDLFINVSFLDHQPSKAKKSLYYVLFPAPIRRTFFGFLRYETILPFLRKFLIIPVVSKGLNNVDEVFSRAGKWLEEKNTIIISNVTKKFYIKFRIYSDTLLADSLHLISFDSPNSRLHLLDQRIDHETSTLLYEFMVSMKNKLSAVINIKVNKKLKMCGVALVSMTVKNMRFFLWNMLKRYLPRYEIALYGSSNYRPAGGIDSYDLFLSDSLYTKKWTHRYLGKKSLVLYPPIDVNIFRNKTRKKNMIISAGRFFVGGHSKRQDILITAFKQMIDEKIINKRWELHLVGGISSGWEHASYIRQLKEASEGYPIFFHFSVDFSTLKRLYAQAKIYWHAAGFGQNELRNPINFEHFGITVVEAMASGCVPIVYRGGGLVETVNGHGDLTWRTINQLKTKTSSIIKDRDRMKRLSKVFQKEANKYSRKNFERQFRRHINKLVYDKG